MSIYPGAIPTNSNYPNRTDDVDWLYAARYNEVKNEIIAICAELGINPKGASATVVARLALLALKASPTFTGQATIPTINLTGGQIAFPATAVPSADANTLDDYEKGTWTPVLNDGTTTGTVTLTGFYTKLGDIVALEISVNAPSGTVAWVGGTSYISGIPFSGAYGAGSWAVPNLTQTGHVYYGNNNCSPQTLTTFTGYVKFSHVYKH